MPNSNVSSAIDAKIIDIMTRKVGEIADLARSTARSNNVPKNIPDAIEVTTVEKSGDGTYKIQIIVDVNKAPAAAAYEYGSGLHKTKGSPGLYPIVAKNAPNLVFWWEKEQKVFVGHALPHGHPGVAPRPYLKPSVQAKTGEFEAALAKAFKDAVLSVTERIEVIRAT